MAKIRVLVFPAGEINAVELHDALSACVNIELWGASSVERHGSYVFKNYVPGLPMITSPDFIEKFNALLTEKHIDAVFPTHDTVAVFLADNAERIQAKIIVADKKTAEICRDKEKTYRTLAGADFLPKIYDGIDSFPVFIKPKQSQGAVGAKLIRSAADIPAVDWTDYVICEYLPGAEYTVDCLTDKNGRLAGVFPRSRNRLMAGVCVAGKTEPLTDEIKHIADTINAKMTFKGLWWFQIKQDKNGKWKLLEVSTRCAGTMGLTRAKGVNLPLLSVYAAMGRDISVEPNDYTVETDRTLISRYKIGYEYDTVYFDFDDTLIIGEAVNLKAVWFLYQCRNLGKKVILLTKHERELTETMRRFAIAENLFSEIIHIKPTDNKADYVRPRRAIFVDNAFQERSAVAQKHHIPVFDADGIDALTDWRS